MRKPKDKLGKALSERQQEILNMLCLTGATNKEIAEKFNTTENTVHAILYVVLNKRGVHSRSKLIVQSWSKRYKKLEEQLDACKKALSQIGSPSNGSSEQTSTTSDAA